MLAMGTAEAFIQTPIATITKIIIHYNLSSKYGKTVIFEMILWDMLFSCNMIVNVDH